MIRVKNVTPPGGPAVRLPLSERMYLVEIGKGMWLTLTHLVRNLATYGRKNQSVVTIQYPEEHRVYSPRFRGRHRLKRNPDGSLRCVACKLCEANCPSNCITVVPEAYPDPSKGHYPKRYEIDITRCIFCGYCVEACPKDAIEMTQVSEMADPQRQVYDKEFLLTGTTGESGA
jgi:NADH-quinone oxidoreductase subunit I